MTDQTADIAWRATAQGRVPVSTRFDDPYFSLDNGLAETRHVFLAGNDLPRRFGADFRVAELGFGTGLNFLTLLACWAEAGRPGTLRMTSFEAFPMKADDMRASLGAFPELAAHAKALLSRWEDLLAGPVAFDDGPTLTLVQGDARRTLPDWAGTADCWFLDGFSPAKNPELWEPDLLTEVARHTAPGGTAATYSAAGHVRRSLAAAGFDVTRAPGFGRKRHMTIARKPA